VQYFGFFLNRIIEIFKLNRVGLLEKIWIDLYFRYKQNFEKQTVTWFNQNKEMLGTVIDVGAGFGFYTWIVAKSQPSAQIYAFEPDPQNFQRLKKTVSKLSKRSGIVIYQKAVSKESSTLFLKRDLYNPANHQTVFNENGLTSVSSKSLDDFCEEYRIVPTLIKIDVQGHERYVLEGAKNVIANEKPVLLIEFDFTTENENGFFCWNFMKKNGYVAYEITKNGETRRVLELPENDSYFDLVFKQDPNPSFL
jgi:FkbM family methyltransferase